MSSRDSQDPIVLENGDEVHPAFGMIQINRTSCTPGAVLFDSEIRHNRVITLRIHQASRKRDLSRDWIFSGREIIEIQMSEAQWAQAITSVNTSGTPATLTWTREQGHLPSIPYAPRMAQSIAEVREAAQKIFAGAMSALEAAEARPTKANLRSLRLAMEKAAGSAEFAAKSLDRHIESTVTRAKADIEAMVSQAAQRGVELDAAHPFELEA